MRPLPSEIAFSIAAASSGLATQRAASKVAANPHVANRHDNNACARDVGGRLRAPEGAGQDEHERETTHGNPGDVKVKARR